MRVIIGYSCCRLTLEAFERHGHDVWTCDLLPSRGRPDRHIQHDIREVANDNWDMGIFHPMCTYLTCAAAWAFNDPDFTRYPGVGYHQRPANDTLTGEARREARREALDNFRWLLALPYPKAIENPANSFLNKAIRPPDQVIHPYQFGDDASKATGLWLDRLPPLALDPAAFIEPRWVCCGKTIDQAVGKYGCPDCEGAKRPLPRWANQTASGQNNLGPSEDRWLERSKTYPGIAKAFGDQWGGHKPCVSMNAGAGFVTPGSHANDDQPDLFENNAA